MRSAAYSSLVHYLEENEMLRLLPFDAAYHPETSLGDIDEKKIDLFIRVARKARNFPLDIGTPTTDVLRHLSLINPSQQVKNAAILLFGKNPQSFFLSSEVKCAQFYGNEVTKPIPSYQVYHGDLFELVKQALDFVASRIDARVGTREHSVQAPVDFELPLDAIREAIVNAVAHRDYTSNASVQVMLFKNRLEIWNPGHLPPGITIEQLSQVHESFPTNPLIANPLYLAGYAERLGTGTVDIINKCEDMGLKAPEYAQTDNFRAIFWRNESNPISSESNPISSEPNPIRSEPNPIRSEPNPIRSELSKRMSKAQIEKLVLSICSDEYLTVNQIATLIGRTTNHIVRVVLPNMLAEGKLVRLYPSKPKHPNQAYKANK